MIYVASRTSRADMWRRYRNGGMRINSTWIDEAGPEETNDFSDLWVRISDEIRACHGLILYAEQSDFPLKGALIEVGIAIGAYKPVALVMPGVKIEMPSMRPIGSWLFHPNVTRYSSVIQAYRDLMKGYPPIITR